MASCEPDDEPPPRVIDHDRIVTENVFIVIDAESNDTLISTRMPMNCGAIFYGDWVSGHHAGDCSRLWFGSELGDGYTVSIKLDIEVRGDGSLRSMNFNDLLLLAHDGSDRISLGTNFVFDLDSTRYTNVVHNVDLTNCTNTYGDANENIISIDTSTVNHCITPSRLYSTADVEFRGFAYNIYNPKDSIGPLKITAEFVLRQG